VSGQREDKFSFAVPRPIVCKLCGAHLAGSMLKLHLQRRHPEALAAWRAAAKAAKARRMRQPLKAHRRKKNKKRSNQVTSPTRRFVQGGLPSLGKHR